ncbi:M24 family metallopeptidase [Microbulbifer echini]|uniref:Xaa-Pro aminopeptidase n=1 Tax=Microbulbifer echini TaxID=1529067 RepID=A0ABV4NLB2_9GAMM
MEVITRGLLDLGLLRDNLRNLLDCGAYQPFYRHRVGHWRGTDVHDVGDYRVQGAWRQLEPGMVMTVEPGIYIPANDEQIPIEFRGMGIRIEGDVALTEQGASVLSDGAPKPVRDIEYTMRHGRDFLTH